MFWDNGKRCVSQVENGTSRLSRRLYAKSSAFLLTNEQRLCKKTLCSGIELICVFLRTMFNHYQNLFSNSLFVSACLASREVWRIQVAILHDAARPLSSIFSPTFLLRWSHNFIQRKTATKRSYVFLRHSEILYCKNKIDKEFWVLELKKNKIESVIRVDWRKRNRNFGSHISS